MRAVSRLCGPLYKKNTQCSSESEAGVQIKDLNLDQHDERGPKIQLEAGSRGWEEKGRGRNGCK